MNTLDKLEYICNKIWHKVVILKDHECYNCDRDLILVREIIFTQEFMDKFTKYFNWWKKWFYNMQALQLLSNLNNATEYLYELIKPNE